MSTLGRTEVEFGPEWLLQVLRGASGRPLRCQAQSVGRASPAAGYPSLMGGEIVLEPMWLVFDDWTTAEYIGG
jgi:hypothetical protein